MTERRTSSDSNDLAQRQIEVAADHQADEARRGVISLLREFAGIPAVAQDDDAVGQCLDLGQSVRDEDQSKPAGLEPGHQCEEPVGFARAE